MLMRSLAVTALSVSLLGSSSASAEVISTETIPIDDISFVYCANGGAGENVHIVGVLHVTSTLTVDNHDGFHLTTHFNYEGVSGVGESTGSVYRGVGQFSSVGNIPVGGPSVFTTNSVGRLVGQGQTPDLVVRTLAHQTVDPADGTAHSLVDLSSLDCK